MTTKKKTIDDLRKLKLEEAIQLLEDEAREGVDPLREIFEGRYESLSDGIEKLFGVKVEQVMKDTASAIKDSAAQSKEFIEHGVKDADAIVRANPWPFIGGGLAIGVIVGILLGRK